MKKEKRIAESKAIANEYVRKISKREREDLKRQVPICPACGQPTCEINLAERYFKKASPGNGPRNDDLKVDDGLACKKLLKVRREWVGDIFFRKRLTEFYVKERLGMSYNALVREVCRINKSRMDPTMKRVFEYINKNKAPEQKKDEAPLENAGC